MAQPRAYTRQANFTDHTTESPSDPQVGSKLDSEFDALNLTLNDIRANLAVLQRDDTKVANSSIHTEALSNAVLALIKATENGYGIKGSWAASTAYGIGDLVESSQATYLCHTAHTSGSTFAANSSNFILLANAAIQTTASAVDTLNGTGTQTAFTLSENAPSGVTDVLVFVNGSLQTPTTHYTLSGTTITFTTAPSSGTNNVIVWGTSTVVEAAKTAAQSARDTALGYQNTTDDYRQTVISYATRVNDYAQTFSADVGTNTTDFSAKEHAVGVANAGALSTGGSAKDWAVYESGTVRGGGSLYSAKVYAADISLGTDTSGGSARGWTQTAEDTDVPGASSGSRSALHYAAKAAASYDSFDDRYLGAKSSDPTVDNDGDALLDGTLYFNTTAKNMRAYDLGTTTWNVLDALPQGLGTTDTPTFATPTSAGHAATKGYADNAGFPSATRMLFQQTAAPTGWTKDTTHNDKALRLTSGTVGTGGSVAFETAFASVTPTITMTNAAHTLVTSEIASHTHTVCVYSGSGGSWGSISGGGSSPGCNSYANSGGTGGNGSHTHSNTAASSAINLDVNFVDVIIATKD